MPIYPPASSSSGSGGAVDSVAASDSTLTISPTTGAVLAAVNQAADFNWTGLHDFVQQISGLGMYSNVGLGNLTLDATETRLADDNGVKIDGGIVDFLVLGASFGYVDAGGWHWNAPHNWGGTCTLDPSAAIIFDLNTNFTVDDGGNVVAQNVTGAAFIAGDTGGYDGSVFWASKPTGQVSGRVNSPDDEAYITLSSAQTSGLAKCGLLLADHGVFLGSIVTDGNDSDKLKFFTDHPSNAGALALWFDHSTNDATFEGNVNVPDEAYGAGWDGSLEVPTKNAVYDKIQTLSGGGGNSVTTTLAFGGSFTDKAQTVVTGQSWVTATSEIVAQVLTPSGVDPDEMRLLDFEAVISDLVVGDGFTVTLYSEPEAKGDYSVMCIGI